MKSGKAWCLALGFFLGASLIPAARAQKEQDQQNGKGSNIAEKSQHQDQNDPDSNAKSGQNSTDSAAKQTKRQPGQDKSESQSGKGSQKTDSNPNSNQRYSSAYQYGVWPSQDQQGLWLSNVLAGDAQGWVRGAGPHSDLNLAAADDSVREHLNLPKGQGIVVTGVAPNSSAAQAGIEQNDILLMLGENPLGKPEDLYDRLKQAGEKSVALTVLRSGSRITILVRPLIWVTIRPVQATAPTRDYWIGISVTPIEPVLRAQLRLSQNHKVIVSEVFPAGPAAKAGIALHDIIVALDGRPVSDPNDVAKSVQAKGESPIRVDILGKGGQSRTIAVTPERKKVTETSQALGNPVNWLTYDVVRPGIVLDYTRSLHNSSKHAGDFLGEVPIISDSSQKSRDASPALTKRLDALDSDLKELRKLVEELQKTATRIIEQQQK